MNFNGMFQPALSQYTHRVLQIRGASFGTGFYIEVEERQYLISAKHVVGENAHDLRVMINKNWAQMPCKILASDDENDIVVLRMPTIFPWKTIQAKMSMGDLIWGQAVWFLGYPFGDGIDLSIHYEGKLPAPFIKWAFVSGFETLGSGLPRLILDGINNVGFSGGPVGFTSKEQEQKICGMITGFKEETQFVESFSTGKMKEKLVYNTNSGIIYAASANMIEAAILSNPTGKSVSEAQ